METAQEFFAALPARVPPGSTVGITNSYLFEILDAGTWLVAIADGVLTVSEGEADADVRFTMREDVFQKLVARELSPVRAAMTGKVKVRGDLSAASNLQKILT
jgi:putative sterol carrier protein